MLSGCAVLAAALVRVVQAGRRAADDHDRELERDRPAAAERGLEDRPRVLAVDVLHRHEVGAVGLIDLVDLGDVLVVERRGELGLVEEHRDEALIAGALAQDRLQHDVALERAEPGLARQIDLRHAAGREVTDHLVPADPQGTGGSGLRRHHYGRIGCLA